MGATILKFDADPDKLGQSKPDGDGTKWISPDKIQIVQNPRTVHNPGWTEEKMDELMRDIKKDGLRYSLIVWQQAPDQYRLLGGERRLRNIMRLLDANEECKCPRGTGRLLPAKEAYATVPCKIVHADSERDARRIARKDNTLHEPLTDFEVLLQVQEMENDGYSRSEQAEDFDKSEAWISQSHSLLALCKEFPQIRDAMFKGVLGRTQALTFLPVWEKTPDKLAEVFETAYQNRFMACQEKEANAIQEQEMAVQELDITETELRLAEMEQNPEDIREAKRKVRRSHQRHKRASEKVDQARDASQNIRLTVEDITSAAKKTSGTEDVLSKPVTVKNVRIQASEIADALEKCEGDEVEFRGKVYPKARVEDVLNTMQWYIGSRKADNPLDLIAG